MASTNQQWLALSQELANVIEKIGESIVAVHGGRRLAASGIHWRSGLIVTASHMLRRDQELSITGPGGRTAAATLVGRDPGTDLALLRSESLEGQATVQTSSGEALKVGHLVVAIGRSHLGDLAVSAGMVARLGGSWSTWRGGAIDRLLRPDLTLYPGQSGSALANAQGEVLGMNTAALARIAAITVPAATIERVLAELLAHGHMRQPYLGLAMQNAFIPADVRGKLQLAQESGLLVVHVEPGGPGSNGGVMLGDVIINLQGVTVVDLRVLHQTLGGLRPGDAAKLTVIRGGERRELNLAVGDRTTQK